MLSDANLLGVLDAIDDALLLLEIETARVIGTNAGAERLFGRTRAQLAGLTFDSFATGETPFTDAEARRRFDEAGKSSRLVYDWQVRREDGALLTVEVHLKRIRFDGAQRILALIRDVAAARRDQQVLLESRAFLEKAQEIAQIGHWISELGASDPITWSREVYRIFGVAPQTSITVDAFFAMVHPEDRAGVQGSVERSIQTRQPYSIEHRIVRPDGSLRWVHERGDVEFDAGGAPRRMIGVVQDITEHKAAQVELSRKEEQLRQAQKLEAVGQLAGGIAHDFNNLLTAVRGYAELLARDLDAQSPSRAHVEEIIGASARAAALTQQLLAYSRRQLLQPHVLNLNAIVADMERLLETLIGDSIECTTILAPDLGSTRADPGQLEQVLANLAVNARDAMPRGGKLLIETRNAHLDPRWAAAHADAKPGDYVILSVMDTGEGMDPYVLSRIFEPFFTTKEKGKGTGLGLSTVYGIVRQSGGHIDVQSERGRGTRVEIYLPRSNEAPEARGEAPAPEGRSPGGNETILLVEDEASVRRLAQTLLMRSGYRVLTAEGPDAALRLARAEPGRIALMVTDVVMYGLTGPELYTELALERPGVRVLYMSAYADDELDFGGADRRSAFLSKPFTPDQLTREVRRILDA